jgi:hypothetical protein
MADIGPGAPMSQTIHTSAPQGTYIRKRPRNLEGTNNWAEEGSIGHRPRPHKKAKGKMADRGVLEAAMSMSRAHHKSSTKNPVVIESEAAGREVGRLAAPNAQEVYYQSPPGPSVREVLVGTTEQDQLPWVEGSEGEETRHCTSGVVQQQVLSNHAMDGEDGERGHFRIPKRGTGAYAGPFRG